MDRLPRRAPRGMTLIELMFVVAILGVVVAGITKAMADLDRSSRVRNLNVAMQGEGRDALQVVERDVRHASLGATLGVIWTQDAAGNVVKRPSVQIFDNASGVGAGLDVKAGTDALLVVGAWANGPRAAAQGASFDSTQGFTVTETAGFQPGQAVLAGPYQEAAWGQLASPIVPATALAPGVLRLATTQNVFPRGRLDAGAMVRAARARLYYVDAVDELVQLELAVPRAPGSAAELGSRNVIARGVENLQVTCEVDAGAPGPCPAPLGGDAVTTEAAWAFGTWAGGGGRLSAASIATLRTVILDVVMRSQSPLAGQQGDAPIVIDNQPPTLAPGGADPTQPYLRRSYRLPIGVRNVSLGAF